MELPDIEVTKNSLAKSNIYNQKVVDVEVAYPKILRDMKPGDFRNLIRGEKIHRIERRGKFLLFHLDRRTLFFHLGMTGKFALSKDDLELKHTSVKFLLENNIRLYFIDPRKFGICYLTNEPQKITKSLGAEPLSKNFTLSALKKILKGHRGAVKPFLLKQNHIAGIGNVYADEILWAAEIHPETKISKLTDSQIQNLHRVIPKVLYWAMKNLHPTVESYISGCNEEKVQPDFLKIYGRAGEICVRCGQKIKKKQVSQKVTFYCPNCQKTDRS